MIVLLVLGVVLLGYMGIQYARHRAIRPVPLVLGILLVVGNAWGLHQTQNKHFLMTPVPLTQTETIKPATTLNGFNLITTDPGVDGELRYTYKIGDKSYQTLTQNATTTVKRGTKPTVQTTVTTYQANSFWRRLMLIGQKTETQGGTTYTLTLPADWYVVNQKQLQELQQMMTDNQKTLTDAVTAKTKEAFADAVKNDDKFVEDKEAQAKLTEKVVADVTAQNQADLKKQMLEKIQTWQ